VRTGYKSRDEARYWGGGVIARDTCGGYWSLHAAPYPGGVDLYAVGPDGRCAWPSTLAHRHVWAIPDDGGAPRILQVREEVRP